MAWPQLMRCRECRRESLDSRWSPLCPVCYESVQLEQRRLEIRPPMLDEPGWTDPARLDAAFESALGSELP